jgi:1-acyl-sn-glycerol-3-phosphate acyltransferase
MKTPEQRLKSLKKFPLFGSFITHQIEETIKYGPPKAAKNLAKRMHTTFTTSIPKKTQAILLHHPCIISFNHPSEIETYAVCAALPDRHDVRMVISANFLSFTPELSNYFIPVWVDHRAKEEHVGKLSGKIVQLFSLRPVVNPIQAHEKNIQSIKIASQYVQKGHIVCIAPEGFRGQNGIWFSGIGHMISGVGTKYNAYYISCYIKNSSDLDWLRLIPYASILLPTIHVYFSKPIPIKEILKNNDNPKQIVKELESDYHTWVKTIL